MDGSLYKTNCDFEKPIPQNIWIEDILVLDFLGCATSLKKSMYFNPTSRQIFVAMASKNRK